LLLSQASLNTLNAERGSVRQGRFRAEDSKAYMLGLELKLCPTRRKGLRSNEELGKELWTGLTCEEIVGGLRACCSGKAKTAAALADLSCVGRKKKVGGTREEFSAPECVLKWINLNKKKKGIRASPGRQGRVSREEENGIARRASYFKGTISKKSREIPEKDLYEQERRGEGTGLARIKPNGLAW